MAAASVHALALVGDTRVEDLEAIVAAVHDVVAADQAVIHAVRRARANGQPWARIATALGTSKQSAIERYGSGSQPARADGL